MIKRVLFTLIIAVFLLALTSPIVVTDFYAAAQGYKGEWLSSFQTDYQTSSDGRKTNVALAVSFINGTRIAPGEEFSFNRVVGPRTTARGFKESITIENGAFVKGVGGGVCQVSTTLYNAVLLAGLTMVKVSPHSLPVSYCASSMDAMVSSATDFCFLNNTPYPVTIYGTADGKSLKFTIYGFPVYHSGESVKYRSVKVKEVEALYEETPDLNNELLEGESSRVIKRAVNGVVSECFKEVYYQGKLVSSTRIRRDYYLPQHGVVLVRKTNDNFLEQQNITISY
ncbi:MAG: VanW family protein [Clostridia bacterium]|nr:VanW family protein [Clostridia bacterium]